MFPSVPLPHDPRKALHRGKSPWFKNTTRSWKEEKWAEASKKATEWKPNEKKPPLLLGNPKISLGGSLPISISSNPEDTKRKAKIGAGQNTKRNMMERESKVRDKAPQNQNSISNIRTKMFWGNTRVTCPGTTKVKWLPQRCKRSDRNELGAPIFDPRSSDGYGVFYGSWRRKWKGWAGGLRWRSWDWRSSLQDRDACWGRDGLPKGENMVVQAETW